MSDQNTRLDAAESRFFLRQKEDIDRTVYEKLYPANKARQFVPLVAGIAESAPVHLWRMVTQYGRAKVLADMGDDVPMVSTVGEESTQIIRAVAAGYQYNVMEIKEAARLGTPLDPERAQTARDVVETEIDEMCSVGNSMFGVKGLLSQTVTAYTLATKAGGGKTWAVATAQEIIDDVTGLCNAVINAMKQASFGGNSGPVINDRVSVVIPLSQYLQIASKRVGDGSDGTVLSWLRQHCPVLESIEPWYRCTGAGDTATDRMVGYVKNSKVLGLILPMEMKFFPAQPEGLKFKVPGMARCGGVILRYPVAMQYADGL